MTIDDAGSVPGSALERARAAALEELRRQPLAVSWRRDAARTVLGMLGATALVIGVGALVSIVEPGRVGARLVPLVLLVALQSVGVFAAIAPGKVALRWIAALLAVAAAAAVLLGRVAGESRAIPTIACSGSHLAVDLIPLGLVLYSLRRFSGEQPWLEPPWPRRARSPAS